jgi:hypothetical protein
MAPDLESLATGELEGRWFPEGMTCAAGNLVSFATGSCEQHEALQERGGAWTLWHWEDGGERWTRVVDRQTARAWLLRNEHFDALSLVGGEPDSQSRPTHCSHRG